MHKPNFQVTATDGQKYWISRSVAVVVVPIFHCEGLSYVPLGKRSASMPLEPGKWGIPCGFIDWGESAAEAVERETQEEIGLRLSDFTEISDQPDLVVSAPNPQENETISLRFVIHCNVDELPKLSCGLPEVSGTRWLEISWSRDWKNEDLAFNHSEIIEWAQFRSKVQ